jgi:hypothetical protein
MSPFRVVGVGVRYGFAILSSRDGCVSTSLETGLVYSVAELDVERSVASVGVWRSAMVVEEE